MNVVIELSNHCIQYNNVLAIARGMVELGANVKMWDSSLSPTLDMMVETQPDLLFYSSDFETRLLNRLEDQYPLTRVVNANVFKSMVVADVVSFRPMKPYPIFQNTEVCLVQYPEIEKLDSIVLKDRMSVVHTSPFRLFSIEKITGANKACGWIPQELHPVIFSSANSVLALSEHTAINAYLCNPRVSLVQNGVERDYEIDEKELDAISSLNIAKSYLRG